MRRTILGFALAFALAGPAASARADEGAQAAACAPATWTDRGYIWHTAGGAWNLSSTKSAKVVCSTVRLGQGSPRNIFLDYYDGSTTAAVSCTAEAWTFGGGLAGWSQSQSSGVAQTGGTFFLFTMPASLIGYIDLRCTIPLNGNASSGIVGFNVQ